MKLSSAAKKELPRITIGVTLCSVITCLVYLLLSKWSTGVWVSALVGTAWVLLNFVFLDITVQKVASGQDEKKARAMMQFSYSLRSLGTLIVCIICFANFGLYAVPVIAAQFYLRLVILVLNKTGKKAQPMQSETTAQKEDNSTDEH